MEVSIVMTLVPGMPQTHVAVDEQVTVLVVSVGEQRASADLP